MNPTEMNPSALLAEDEPLLMTELVAHLTSAWPQLNIVAQAKNGIKALEQIRALRPQVAFLDIRMPGLSGLEVAQALAEDTLADETVPLIVFITAYGEFALEAFERSAIDYLLKPVTTERLAITLQRLRSRLAESSQARDRPGDAAQELADQLAPLLRAVNAAGSGVGGSSIAGSSISDSGISGSGIAGPGMPTANQTSMPTLKYVRVGRGNSVHMVPLDQIHYFQAADKYVTVATADGEGLIRESLRELQARLDPERFLQIHRSTLVNLDFIERADRDELGHTRLKLRGVQQTLMVSRLYTHLFKAM
jgi:DNA-binding LytR/AlgR family response regulator